ncbi:MAG: hydroxymethylglutaryl-CoA synthase [archaeon]
MKAGIVSWGVYIPYYRIKVEEIAKIWGADSNAYKEGLLISEKSVPGIDEDSATIAVEASRNALKRSGINPKEIGAVYFGSESHPYAVKPTGTIVAQAIETSDNYTTADLEFACKAGTAAIQISLSMIKSGFVKYALAGGVDTAQAAPGDALEYTASAGGAAFIIGSDNVCVEINNTLSFTTDTPDFWRRENQRYPAHGGGFTGEHAYFKHILNASKNLMAKAGTKPSDYNYAVFHQPNGKFPRRVAQMLGFSKEQIALGLVVDKIGNTYSGSSLIGLSSVLDHAKPGDRILLTSYGSGAGSDSFDLTVTENIIKAKDNAPTVKYYIDLKKYIDYSQYAKITKKFLLR